MVNLEIIRDLVRKERRSDELVELDNDFYTKAGKYIVDLEDSIRDEENKNKELMIRDEKNSAEKLLKKLLERRTGKIINNASLNVSGLDIDTDKMTITEKNLFRSLSEELKKGRDKIKEKIFSRQEEMNKRKGIKKENFNNSEKSFTVIRILDDFPKFVGSDERSHYLSKEDVVALPKEDAKVLIKRDVAEKIEG